MIIKQEENSPVCDVFDKLKLETSFNGITEIATGRIVDTDLLKEYVSVTVSILKDFEKSIESIEKKEIKNKNKDKVLERLYGNDPYGD